MKNSIGMTRASFSRTGQPGYAPEENAIRDYDINDYKTKNELTRKKLLTALTAAIRSYDQLRTIEASRRGLHQIITSSASFSVEGGVQGFASGCDYPISGLMRRTDGRFIVRTK